MVISNVPACSPSSHRYQDDAINVSWHHDYMPYMLQQEYRRQDPNLDEKLAEMQNTFEEVDRHHYSAMLEDLRKQYYKDNPDDPDPDIEAKADYEAYMAAHPGLAEKIAREDEEERLATTLTDAQFEELMNRDS